MRTWLTDDLKTSVSNLKAIKSKWADTARDPEEGEVQDLGWKNASELPEIFLTALEGVEPGNLIGPIKSEYGYHLIWFEKERFPETPDDEMVEQALLNDKFSTELDSWLRRLLEYNVYIKKVV